MASRRITEGAFAAGLVAGSSAPSGTARGGGAAGLSLPDSIPTRRFSTLHSSTKIWPISQVIGKAARDCSLVDTNFSGRLKRALDRDDAANHASGIAGRLIKRVFGCQTGFHAIRNVSRTA